MFELKKFSTKTKKFWIKYEKLILIIAVPILCSIVPLIFRNKVLFE
jgi:hypothetical protein